MFKDTFINIIDFEKLNNDKIYEEKLLLPNIDIGFNSTTEITTFLPCLMD